MLPLLHDTLPDEWEFPGQPAFRNHQIAEWIFQKKAVSFAEMTNLPADFRDHLKARYDIRPLKLEREQGSRDTTRKFLFSTRDGDYIECVLIPASPGLYGNRSDRFTLCVSSQVGCAYGCKFCASGLDGWKRNLSPAEITSQVIEVERITGDAITNLVFMGMGEPFANYPNLMRAIQAIHAHWGLGMGARRITVSTSGLVPVIRKFAEQPLPVRLAVSLHGASDDVRSQIMPVNEKFPLDQLFEACRYFNQHKKQKITFEYILIDGFNDAPEQARLLARKARSLNAKINLIPYNQVDGLEWNRSTPEATETFHRLLTDGGVQTTLRLEKGHDIDAACGQLRLRQKQEAT